ncbi:MAG: WYL domain-containing protein [Parvibaculaceae bacterium]
MTVASSPAEARAGGLRWSVERRLAFIEERLYWLGHVNRTDLVRRFGVSMSQASGDIARYLALEPQGVSYDKRGKRYAADDAFLPMLAKPDARRFLGEMRLVDQGILTVEDTLLGELPPFDATPVPERAIDPAVLRVVLNAIREKCSVDALYQSMTRPAPSRRVIEPHALAHDGFRWHARAFDRKTHAFRDFVLGRISKPKLADPALSQAHQDEDWENFVPLLIAPHPKLTPAQAQAIAIDYRIKGRSLTLKVRRALLFYALKRLGLDVREDARPPHEQHITLLNRADIEKILARMSES